LPNRYRAISFISPAAEAPGTLSDALVCRRHHDRYAVMEEKWLLTGAEGEVGMYPERCRRTMNRVCEAFELVKETERDLENSPTSIISPTDYRHPSLTTT
jgi:hypothetical protein